MSESGKRAIEYTLATQAIENIIPSTEAVSMCEEISDGHLSADAAVAAILIAHGVKSR